MTNASTSLKDALVAAVHSAIDSNRPELAEIAKDIHAHPELNYQERHAATLLSGSLEKYGFSVERGVGGVETAFRATLPGGGGDGPTVAILTAPRPHRRQEGIPPGQGRKRKKAAVSATPHPS